PPWAAREETCTRKQLFPARLGLVGSEGRRRLDELEFRAWRALVYAYSAVVPKLDEELANAQGVSLNQFEILTLLAQARKRGLRMSDLASQVVLSPSGLTRAVDQLE